MGITAADVKKLRDRTGLGMMDCKRALEEADGDIAKAEELLRKKGLKAAELRSTRTAAEGLVGHYVHMNGKIGVLVELNCETDFVARNEAFAQLLKDLCMQVAATNPAYLAPEDVPEEDLERERGILTDQFKDKPEHVREKIAEGKLKDYYKQVCLVEQPFIKDTAQSVQQRITEAAAKLGEKIAIGRFVRFEVGEEA